MSVRWISEVWETSPYVGRRLLLHLALADFANDEGTCFPSQRALALKARTTEAWVSQSVRQMITDGYLEIVAKGNGRGNRTTYQLRKGSTQLGETHKGETESRQRVKVQRERSIYKNRQEPSYCADIDFDRFWAKYPRRVAKIAARNVFVKVMTGDNAPAIDELLTAVENYAQSVTDKKYYAHPATWLRQGRWADEYETQEGSTTVKRDAELENALAMVLPLARLGRTWEECVDVLSDASERVIAECRAEYDRVRNNKWDAY